VLPAERQNSATPGHGLEPTRDFTAKQKRSPALAAVISSSAIIYRLLLRTTLSPALRMARPRKKPGKNKNMNPEMAIPPTTTPVPNLCDKSRKLAVK